MTPPVLLDNTVLTNFAVAGLDRLPGLLWPSEACTTPAALGEYRAGVFVRNLPESAWADLLVVTLVDAENALAEVCRERAARR